MPALFVDWFLLIADMSAMPAASVNLESLPDNASGHVLFEILQEEDRQQLNVPENITVHWLVNPCPERENSIMLDRLKSIDWPATRPAVWVAGEYRCVRAIRDYLNAEMTVEKKRSLH